MNVDFLGAIGAQRVGHCPGPKQLFPTRTPSVGPPETGIFVRNVENTVGIGGVISRQNLGPCSCPSVRADLLNGYLSLGDSTIHGHVYGLFVTGNNDVGVGLVDLNAFGRGSEKAGGS